MSKKLYKEVVSMRDRVKEAQNALADHLDELETIIKMYDKKQVTKKNSEFVSSVVKDALEDATETLKAVGRK